jgi:uncharacterized protein with HEPN domain
MASGGSRLHLAQMFENIERIRGWTSDLTLDAYLANSMPQIPWRKVADIGNVLRHEYDDVADTEIWRIVVDDLGTLRTAVLAMIREQ